MRKYLLLLLAFMCPSIANAYMATFEEISPGSSLSYYLNSSGFISIGDGFDVVDHSESTWGISHSPNNVLANNMTGITRISLYGIPESVVVDPPPVYASYFGAYFSTAPSTVLNMKIEGRSGILYTMTIGDYQDSWTNKYISFSSPAGDITGIAFTTYNYPMGSSSFFSMDDLTITPVPEPSSILALLAGIAGIGGFAWRRK